MPWLLHPEAAAFPASLAPPPLHARSGTVADTDSLSQFAWPHSPFSHSIAPIVIRCLRSSVVQLLVTFPFSCAEKAGQRRNKFDAPIFIAALASRIRSPFANGSLTEHGVWNSSAFYTPTLRYGLGRPS